LRIGDLRWNAVKQALEAIPHGRIVPGTELKTLGMFFPDRYFGELIFLVQRPASQVWPRPSPVCELVNGTRRGMLSTVKANWSRALPYIFMVLAALSRWPGLFPSNFSAFYGLAFCAGAFFSRSAKWYLPLGTLVVTDIVLGLCYYRSFSAGQLANYAAFAGIILLGTRFSGRSSFLRLLSGGILGAVLFYLITNTAAWLFDPNYPKNLAGWFLALTKGRSGYPPTLAFFWNTLMSGGLFTGLFAGAMKLTNVAESPEEKEPEEAPAEEPAPEEVPEEGKA